MTILLILLCLGNTDLALNIEPELRFSRISSQEGLPHNLIYGIAQDHRGFLWVSTFAGFSRYDGYSFKTYRHNPLKPKSLSESSTGHSLEDEQGIFWVSTWGGGLNRFNPQTEEFQSYKHDPNNPESISNNRLQHLLLSRDGVLWIGTYSGGLNRMDREKGTFKRYLYDENKPNGIPSNRIWSIKERPDGLLWLATDAGISLFDPQKETFKNYSHDPKNPNSLSHPQAKCLILGEGGLLWVGTLHGLNRFDPFTESFTRFLHDENNPKTSLSNNNIRCMVADQQGKIWIGTTGGGLSRVDPLTEQIVNYRHVPEIPYTLAHNKIEAIFIDRSNVLWVGTLAGMSKADLKPEKFHQYANIPEHKQIFSSNRVSSIFIDKKGHLWTGSFDNGLTKYNRATGESTYYLPGQESGLADRIVRSICEDKDGRIWAGTYSAGLHQLDETQEKFTQYLPSDDPYSISHYRIRAMRLDHRGSLWIGTEDGLNRYLGDGRFENQKNNDFLARHIKSRRINAIYQDKDHHYWIGSEQGLIYFNETQKRVIHYRSNYEKPGSLSQNRIQVICASTQGIWVGTSAGLNLLNRSTGSFRKFFVEDGLPSNHVVGILADEKDNIWVSTGGGLARLNGNTYEIRVYDVFDGLQGIGFSDGAYFKNPNGEMFFGGNNGINYFKSSKVEDNPYPPLVQFTGFRKFNKTIPQADIIEKEEVSLKYNENVFTLEFAALDYSKPQKNQYAYTLEGFEEEWNYVGTQRQVTYTNLDPGDYTFKVRGSNNDNVWNEAPLTLKVVVVPPIWLTWWAKLLYICVGFAALIGIPTLRIYQLRLREERLAAEVELRTKELTQSNIELDHQNRELEAIDTIVQAINSEFDLDTLLDGLLIKVVNFIPSADKGGLLTYNEEENIFRFSSVVGYNLDDLKDTTYTYEGAIARYSSGDLIPSHQIYLIDDFFKLKTSPDILKYPLPKCMVAMPVTVKDQVVAIILLENMTQTKAFSESEFRGIERLRNHIVTAAEKAKLFKELRDAEINLRKAQQLLMESAHKAGMAEIMTNVLHNMGNTLNSVMVSVELLRDLSYHRSVTLFSKVSSLLTDHRENLNHFLSHDPKGQKVPAALLTICDSLANTHTSIQKEAKYLVKYVHELQNAIQAEEAHAFSENLVEQVQLIDCLNEALKIQDHLLAAKHVTVNGDYENSLIVRIQKSKFMRVLVTLIHHAVESLSKSEGPHFILVRAAEEEDETIIEIEDNGKSLPADAIPFIFQQGFARSKGMTSDLHYCANAMNEMGGEIRVIPVDEGNCFQLKVPH